MSMLLFASVAAYLLFYVFFLWRYVASPENRVVFEKRRFEIDEDFIHGYVDDGSYARTTWRHVVRVVNSATYYLLYISKAQFFYLPYDAFASEADRGEFEAFLHKQNLI